MRLLLRDKLTNLANMDLKFVVFFIILKNISKQFKMTICAQSRIQSLDFCNLLLVIFLSNHTINSME